MKRNEKVYFIILLVASITVGIGIAVTLEKSITADYDKHPKEYYENDNPDKACKKWIGIVELAKQDYPHLIEPSLEMAKIKCGFDVNNIIP